MAGPTIAQEAVEAEIDPPVVARAILVMPDGSDKLHVKYAYVYTLLLPDRGAHLDPDVVEHLLGSRRLLLHRLHDGEALLAAIDASGPTWRLCCSGPHRGPGLVLRLTSNGEALGDTRLDLEQVAGMLTLDEVENEEEDRNGREAA